MMFYATRVDVNFFMEAGYVSKGGKASFKG